jgi:hypothetical protein
VDVNDEGLIRAIAERAVVSGKTSHHGVVEVTADMVGDAMRLADRLGTLHKDKMY